MSSIIRRPIRHHPVVAFFGLAFLWTWGCAVLLYLSAGPTPGLLLRVPLAWGPLIAASIVTLGIGGNIREWAGQVTKWRVKPRWYVIAVAVPLLWEDGLATGIVHILTGGAVHVLPAPWWHYVANFVGVFLLAGGLEEFGWRGFAQPRLQERYSALTGAIIIGTAWALWHLPLFYLFDLTAFDQSDFLFSYLPHLVVEAVVLAWLYNSTGGSVLFPMLAHSLGNLPAVVTPTGDLSVVAQYTNDAVTVGLVVGIVVMYGPAYLAASTPTPLVPGAGRGSGTSRD